MCVVSEVIFKIVGEGNGVVGYFSVNVKVWSN